MNEHKKMEQFTGEGILLLLMTGSFFILKPFITSLLWGSILCYTTWPVYGWFCKIFGGRRTLAALVLTVLSTGLLIAPFVIVSVSFVDNIQSAGAAIEKWEIPHSPEWVSRIPAVGKDLRIYLDRLSEHTLKLNDLLRKTLNQPQVQDFIVNLGKYLIYGIIQLSLSVFLTFFFYRGGEAVVLMISQGIKKIWGSRSQRYVLVTGKTVRSVVFGVIGTALIQGVIAGLGFWVSPLPSALFFAFVTFFLALVVPGGASMIFTGVCLWLLSHDKTGWTIFMVFYGIFVSLLDNFTRPYLISRETKLPYIIVFIGVLGGLEAFGFLGIFLGPTLLFISYSLILEWLSDVKSEMKEEAETNTPKFSYQ